MSKSRKALQPFWAKMFQDYSNHVKHLQTQNPTWEQMVNLERYRQALLDFRFNRKCSKRREGIRLRELQKFTESKKIRESPYLKRKLSQLTRANAAPQKQGMPIPLPSLIPARKLLQLNNKVVRFLNFHSMASDRLKELAKSRKRPVVSEAKPWRLTSAMRLFEPSDRLLSLASHKPYKEPRNPYKVPSRALLYEASPRILHLAEPHKKGQRAPEHLRSPPRQDSKETTQRIRDLARPKLREDKANRRMPYKVPDRALRAKPTPRLLELAQPRM